MYSSAKIQVAILFSGSKESQSRAVANLTLQYGCKLVNASHSIKRGHSQRELDCACLESMIPIFLTFSSGTEAFIPFIVIVKDS